MQNLDGVVTLVHVEERIDQQVRRIKRSSLAFCDQRITKAAAVIPEREFAFVQPLGKELFLWEEVGVGVSADESSARPERLPEDDRQANCQRNDCQRFLPCDTRLGLCRGRWFRL
jgi:hypothetical protein